MNRLILHIGLVITTLVLFVSSANAQIYKVRGYVYDSSRNFPLEAVSVLSTSGKGTTTNADGYYIIEVAEKILSGSVT
ncbi:MAG: hypothetical protein IPP11_11960 [Chitinophagaceae bacterium]|nr:hypothetical protein [Chitinophagaceae bacterium]